MPGFGEIPRGLEDLKAAVVTADTPGTNVDVPGARSLSWTVESDSDQLEGDNEVIAIARNPKTLTGSYEIGRMNLAGLAATTGGTAGTTGTTPNQIIALDENAATDVHYFQLTGQAPGADATDSAYRVTLKKLQVTGGPDESLTVNDWSTPTLDFEGIAISGALLTRQNYETEVAIS